MLGPAIPDLLRSVQSDGPPEAVLNSCWDALVQHGVHTDEAMTRAFDSFWNPDDTQTRDAVSVYEWGRQGTPPAIDEVTRSLTEVSNLRSSLHAASHRLMTAVSRAGFLHHVMRRAQHTAPQLESRGLVP